MGEATTAVKSDIELVEDFKKGDESAFNELVRRHKEKAMQAAYSILGNYEDAKDASQEAFVKAYHALKGFEMKSKFSTWFYRILMNCSKDALRKKKWQKLFLFKREDEEAEENPEIYERIPDKTAAPDKGVYSDELACKMNDAIQELPFKQRWIFTLRFQQDMSLKEIAQATNLSEGTVKASLHFAIQKFKTQMTPYLKEGGK